ncbi:MAG: hypothetical protein LBL33_00480 [Tannerella sp.]|jgi:hypothetical protein|nr:hypothetical protein [Tannerella sp.]
MLRNCLITELRDTPRPVIGYDSILHAARICVLPAYSGQAQACFSLTMLLKPFPHTSWARAPIHRGRGRPYIVGAGVHTSWVQAPIHRGRRRPYIVGAGAHTSWAQASIHRGRGRPYIMGAGVQAS